LCPTVSRRLHSVCVFRASAILPHLVLCRESSVLPTAQHLLICSSMKLFGHSPVGNRSVKDRAARRGIFRPARRLGCTKQGDRRIFRVSDIDLRARHSNALRPCPGPKMQLFDFQEPHLELHSPSDVRWELRRVSGKWDQLLKKDGAEHVVPCLWRFPPRHVAVVTMCNKLPGSDLDIALPYVI